MENNRAWHLARYHQRRTEFFADKACKECGAKTDLELDHIDPTLKKRRGDHRLWTWSAARREAEIAKCQVLCKPCHLAKSIAEGSVAPVTHGTRNRYRAGCRCPLCIEWEHRNNLRRRLTRKARRIAEGVVKTVGRPRKVIRPAGIEPATLCLEDGTQSFQETSEDYPSDTNPGLHKPKLCFIFLALALHFLTLQSFALSESVGGEMPRSKTGSVFQLKNGTWWARVSFKDELGIRRERWRRAENKTDAKDKRDGLLADLREHGPLAMASDRVSFAELAEYYEKQYLVPAEYRDGRKVHGLRAYDRYKSLLSPLKKYFGTKRLRSLTYGDLRNYRLMRLRSKNSRDANKLLSVATVNRELSLLRRLLSIAQQQRWLLHDLFKQGEALITAADEKPRERTLSPAEESRLLAQCVGPRLHLRGLVICGLDTGMRRGEILLLRWEDVGLDAGMITVRAMHTKTLRERQLGITARLGVELRRIYAERIDRPNERVFGLESNFKRSWGTACKNAGIADLRFHDLRHTFATRLAEAGFTDALIARLLGHSQSARMTFRYTNLTQDTARKAAEILGGRMK